MKIPQFYEDAYFILVDAGQAIEGWRYYVAHSFPFDMWGKRGIQYIGPHVFSSRPVMR